jgi:hypothetical protein
MLKKKSQMIHSEIFVYILALVVFSLILLYGYKAIANLRGQSDQISTTQFKTDMKNTVEKLGYEFGTVEVKSITVPNGVSKVCFAEIPSNPADLNAYHPAIDDYNLIEDSLSSGSKDNVFLIGSKTIEPLSIIQITLEDKFKCFDVVSGRINVRLEAKGNVVAISNPE